MNRVVELAKEEFKKHYIKIPKLMLTFDKHLDEMEKLAYYMFEKYDGIDKEIVLISIYLHDIGYFFEEDDEKDHAVLSEKFAHCFLSSLNYDESKLSNVLHSVRAHRNKDVIPNTMEAKVIATIDSLSHITGGIYFDMIKHDNKIDDVLEKLRRDYRDLGFFKEVQDDFSKMTNLWEELLIEYKKIS